MLSLTAKRHTLPLASILIALQAGLLFLVHNTAVTVTNPINADGFGYYAYLPALFIDHRLAITNPLKYEPTHHQLDHPALVNWQTSGTYLIKYPPGVALMVAPFFLLAYLISALTGATITGYGPIFQWLTGLSAGVYASLGLILLWRLYQKETSPRTSLATVAVIFLATNLLTYTAYSPLMSHAFAFAAVAAVLYFTKAWLNKPTPQTILALGLATALAIMIRNTHILLLVFIIGYNLTRQKKPSLSAWLTLLAVILISLLPQITYHLYITGHPWVFSYPGEGFNWADPTWYGTLLSPRRGLLFWSPIWLLAIIGAIKSRHKPWFWPAVIFLALQTYVIASWRQWSYGDGYGHRVAIDLYPIMGLFLAQAIQHLNKNRLTRILFITFATLCILVNLKLMYRWWQGILPRDHARATTVLHTLIN